MLKDTLNKGISISIAIVLIWVILVGGFTWWQYREIRREETELPEIKLSEKEEAEETEELIEDEGKEIIVTLIDFSCNDKDKETGWIICRNEDYKFEVKRPGNLCCIDKLAIITDCNYVTFQEDCSDIDDLILAFAKEYGCGEYCLEARRHNLSNWGDKYRVNTNNASFCVYESTDCGMGRCETEYYYLTIKEKDCYLMYSSSWTCAESHDNEDKIFEEIISTFKFID